MLIPYEMTSNRRLILVCLVLATIVISALVGTTEASRYHNEDAGIKSPHHRHRHRHDGTSVASSRRNHELSSIRRGSIWPEQDDDYEDAFEADDDDDEDDEDYEMERSRNFHERTYQPSRKNQRNHHSRFEPRFPLRHHQASGHHGNPWYRGGPIEEDPERRRNSRYGGAGGVRSHRLRSGRDRTYHDDRRVGTSAIGHPSRIHEFDDPEEELEDEVEADRENGYDRASRRWRLEEDTEENSQDYRSTGNVDPPRWRNSRRYRGRQDSRRTDWKSRTPTSAASSAVSSISSVPRNEDDDWTERRRKTVTIHRGGKRTSRLPIDDPESDDLEDDRSENKGTWSSKRWRNNFIDHAYGSGTERKKENDVMNDRDYENDTTDNGETKNSDKIAEEEKENEEEEENIWKEAEEDPDEEDDIFDNTNYYKTEDEPPYKTFDDIIKSLTSEDPTTMKPIIRRDYRNIGIEKYLKRDAYGNMYDSRNITMTRIGHDGLINGKSYNWTNNANKWRLHDNKPDIANYPKVRDTKKVSNAISEGNGWQGSIKERERKKVYTKLDETSTRTKSLEQEYDEDYENNEKDEDVVKIGGEQVTGMQADINNTEYADEENETETEDETSAPLATSPPTTTTTSTTTTTTTTPRPVVTTPLTRFTQDRRDSRSYETSSASQSNGLPQQSVHIAQKWQSLNTRDGAKISKGHGQQNNNRNGKSAEIKEALQHAIKVSREGSCQWPRARVIPVRDVYPSPSTTYIPHCAILHRCSDDTGCCRSEALTCVPKVSHRVELYFYTTSVGGASVVEKLSFYNHTECECKERSEYGASSDKTTGTNEHRFTRHHPPAVSPPQNIRRPPQRKPCRCPSEFTPRITPEGECQCNCFENDQSCIRTRRGKGYFSLRDRLCIQNEECATPICEFGEYMRRQGKCPRKKDRFDAIANYPTNMNLHHRLRS